MMNSFLINTTFLNTVSKLRKHFDNTQVSEIRITPTTIKCYNKEGQNVDIFFGKDITTIPMKKARLPLLLEDIRIKNISDYLLKEIVGEYLEVRANDYSLLLLEAYKVHKEELKLESLAYNNSQEHQSSLLPQPLVSIGLSEPSKVQKDVTPSTQESNVDTNSLLSGLSAKSLFARNDKRVRGYNKNEVLNLLLNTEVHSPELKKLLRYTLDKHSRLGLGSGQSRTRNYDDSRFLYLVSCLKDIPRWAYVISESENEKISETSMKRRRVTDYDRSIIYSRNSELETVDREIQALMINSAKKYLTFN
ncbi:19127_t:CDS:2 [Dentiscutata erythropus]|uniref:19127_t:CDS:1 n=1 Tax=Dentiscutata erythropus TaxID=1348616 RepID=A0A9N9DWK6_9GLOM|nr:19127_t:CDS:2 [Dentiscutata erythropus]